VTRLEFSNAEDVARVKTGGRMVHALVLEAEPAQVLEVELAQAKRCEPCACCEPCAWKTTQVEEAAARAAQSQPGQETPASCRGSVLGQWAGA
jgi:hypothetical protein